METKDQKPMYPCVLCSNNREEAESRSDGKRYYVCSKINVVTSTWDLAKNRDEMLYFRIGPCPYYS